MNTYKHLTALRMVVALAFLLPCFGSSYVQATPGLSSSGYVPGEVLVKFKPGVAPAVGAGGVNLGAASLNALAARYGVTAAAPLFPGGAQTSVGLERIYKLRLSPAANTLGAVEELAADPHLEYAEPNYIFRINSFRSTDST